MLVYCMSPSEGMWVGIEAACTKVPNMKLLLLVDAWKPFMLSTLPPITQASILAWRHLRLQSQYEPSATMLRLLIETLEILLPYCSVNQWAENGIRWVNELMEQESPKSLD